MELFFWFRYFFILVMSAGDEWRCLDYSGTTNFKSISIYLVSNVPTKCHALQILKVKADYGQILLRITDEAVQWSGQCHSHNGVSSVSEWVVYQNQILKLLSLTNYAVTIDFQVIGESYQWSHLQTLTQNQVCILFYSF